MELQIVNKLFTRHKSPRMVASGRTSGKNRSCAPENFDIIRRPVWDHSTGVNDVKRHLFLTTVQSFCKTF